MSIRLASRDKSPPNGFRFQQLHTKWRSWEADPTTLWDFSGLCRAVQKHRQANPQFRLSTDMAAIALEVDAANARRIMTIPGAEIYVVSDGEGGANMAPPKAAGPHPSVAAKSKLLNAGYQLLQEWKQEGYGVVEQAEAERRAAICAACPKNGDGGLERYFTIPFSKLLKKQAEGFNELALATPNDGKIGVCSACLCPLRLKIWCELELIEKHLLPEARAELDANCWIINK